LGSQKLKEKIFWRPKVIFARLLQKEKERSIIRKNRKHGLTHLETNKQTGFVLIHKQLINKKRGIKKEDR